MTKNLKFFLVLLILSIPLGWGINALEKNLENFFYWQEFAENPRLLAAQANRLAFEQNIRDLKPIRNKGVKDLDIEAKSAISVFVDPGGKEKILLKKDANQKLPIASLTKLISARVVLDDYDLDRIVEISEQAAQTPESEETRLKEGESFQVKALLRSMLIESNNIAAYALAEVVGEKEFVELMNLTAKDLGLENTHFVNSTGLDPKNYGNAINYSTAQDLLKLTEHSLSEEPLIWTILATPEFDLYSSDGSFHHEVVTTNELLREFPSLVGSKTGETPQAGGCLLLVLRAPKDQGYLINVILNSQDRFKEMRELVDWLSSAYRW